MDKVWELQHSTREWGKYPSENLVATILRRYPDRDYRELLTAVDLGCGAGANLFFLLNEGFRVTGVDGSQSAIRKAAKRLRSHPDFEKLTLLCSTFSGFFGYEEHFDVAIDYLAFYCGSFKEVEANYSMARRILKPSGMLYSRVWGRNTSGSSTGLIIEPGTSMEPIDGPCKGMGKSHFFTLKEIDSLFEPWSSHSVSRIETCLPDNTCIEEFVIVAYK